MKFKRKLSILILTILVSTSIQGFAQDKNEKVGIKGGLNLSNIFNEEVNDQNMRLGYHAGLFFKAPLTDHFAIQPELLYSTKGATTKYDNFLSGDGEFTQKFNYIEAPVLAVLNLSDNINIHAGPYFAFLLNASVENKSQNSDFNFVEELNEDDFERLDYGLAVGIGFEFDAVHFGARYDYGMRDIGKEQEFSFNESEASSDDFKNSRNSVFALYLGLNF